MIIKEIDDRTSHIAELKLLKEQAPEAFHRAVQNQIDNLYAGIAGEKEAAHFINRAFGQHENIAILHDLRIGVAGDFAQIDHLVVHRLQAKAWVLETKNYRGRLTCDEHGDWTVWYGSRAADIPSPVNQAVRQCELLQSWLKANSALSLREIEPVVLLSPASSIDRKHLPRGASVVKSDNFPPWWRQQQEKKIGVAMAFALAGRHLVKGMSQSNFASLCEQLRAAHEPMRYDWRAKLRLPLPQDEPPKPSASTGTQEAGSTAGHQIERKQLQIIATPHGEIKISRLPDGRYALRNDRNEELIAIVRRSCSGKGRWNPRYQNWLLAESDLPDVLSSIRASQS